MRGRPNRQRSMLTMVDLRERGPNDHLLGTLKSLADTVSARLSPARVRPLVRQGRTGIGAVRTLLKASLLAALYSVCSERALCGGGGVQPAEPQVPGYGPAQAQLRCDGLYP